MEVVRPQAGGIQRTIQQPASIHAFETVNLYAMVSGYLKTQAVDIGSRIKKGEVLAEINVPRDAKAVEEAAALVEQARAQIVQADAQIQVAEAEQGRRGRGAAGRIGRRSPEGRAGARREAVRPRQRAGGGQAVDQRLVNEQQSALDAARAAEQTVRDRRADGQGPRAGRRGRGRQGEGRRRRGQGGAGRGRVAAATARKVNLQYARIVAPFDGVVTHRTFHPGALIRSAMEGGQQPLLTVKRTDLMRVVVLVPDRDVVLTRVGDTAVVSVDALDGRSFQGTLARIAQSEDAERMMRVEIDLPNPDAVLYDGMYGKASITLQPNARQPLPAAGLHRRALGPLPRRVYVVRDGVARRTEVKLGGDDGSLVEILSGIKPGRCRGPALGHAARGRHARRHAEWLSITANPDRASGVAPPTFVSPS